MQPFNYSKNSKDPQELLEEERAFHDKIGNTATLPSPSEKLGHGCYDKILTDVGATYDPRVSFEKRISDGMKGYIIPETTDKNSEASAFKRARDQLGIFLRTATGLLKRKKNEPIKSDQTEKQKGKISKAAGKHTALPNSKDVLVQAVDKQEKTEQMGSPLNSNSSIPSLKQKGIESGDTFSLPTYDTLQRHGEANTILEKKALSSDSAAIQKNGAAFAPLVAQQANKEVKTDIVEETKKQVGKVSKANGEKIAMPNSKDVLIRAVEEPEELSGQTLNNEEKETIAEEGEMAAVPTAPALPEAENENVNADAAAVERKKHRTSDDLILELSERINAELQRGDGNYDIEKLDAMIRRLCSTMLHRSSVIEHQHVREARIEVRDKAFKQRDSHHSIFGFVLQAGGATLTILGGCIGGVASTTMLLQGASKLPDLLNTFVTGMKGVGDGLGGFNQIASHYQEGIRVVVQSEQQRWQGDEQTRSGEEKRHRDIENQWKSSAESSEQARHRTASELLGNTGG